MKIAPANDLGRLAPASEVAGEHAIKCFKIGRPCPFLNGKVCPPTTSVAGARRQLEQFFMSYLSIYFYCSTLVVATTRSRRLDP
jgi:hypothetical protein